jgi:agmatinase
MDPKELERLRARYSEARGDDITDEGFKRVAAKVFSDDGARPKPYSGIPTFLDADQADGPDHLDVALIGVPMDLGVTNRPGARFGPRAVRAIERIGPYHHHLKALPLSDLRCADIGDVPFRSRYSIDASMEDIERFYRTVVQSGARPLSVGGDHSITYPILKAIGEGAAVGCVHIDAHCDTAGEFDGSKFHHGGPFRQAVLDGVLDPERTIQIGIRGSSEYLWEFSYDAGMTVIHIEDFAKLGVDAVVEKCLEVLCGQSAYISLDVDGLDPAFAPGTGTPEIGGLAPREVQNLLWGLKGQDIVGGDVVEIAPQYDSTTNTAQLGAQFMFEILSLMSTSLGTRSDQG